MMVGRSRLPNASQRSLRIYEQRVTCLLKSNGEGGDPISDLPQENSTFCSDRHLPEKKEVARRGRSLFQTKPSDHGIVIRTRFRGASGTNRV